MMYFKRRGEVKVKSLLKILGGAIVATIGAVVMLDGLVDENCTSVSDVEDNYYGFYDDIDLYED